MQFQELSKEQKFILHIIVSSFCKKEDDTKKRLAERKKQAVTYISNKKYANPIAVDIEVILSCLQDDSLRKKEELLHYTAPRRYEEITEEELKQIIEEKLQYILEAKEMLKKYAAQK